MMIPRYTSDDALDRKTSFFTLTKIFGRFARFLIPYWDKVLLRLLVQQANAFIGLIPPLLMIRIIDESFPQKNWGLAVQLVVAAWGMGVFSLFLTLINDYVYQWVMMFVRYRIEFAFLRHLQKLSIAFFDSRPVGEHYTRATYDPWVVNTLIVDTIPNAIGPFQTLAAAIAVIATIKVELAYMALLWIVPYLIGQHLFYGWYRNLGKISMARYQEQQGRYVELLNAFKTTRAMHREATERRKLWTTWARSGRIGFRMWWVSFFMQNSLGQYYAAFFSLLVPLVTCHWVIKDQMTVGEYTAAIWIVSQLLTPLFMLADFFQTIRYNLIHAERLLDTLEVEPDMADEAQAFDLPPIEGRIDIENVSYSYPGGEPVLRNISLAIEPGRKAAIVGPSGAGKSTLLGLICRFYNPTDGRVTIDGNDLRNVTRGSLMAQIGVVLQDTLMLMGSIGENIWYGGKDPTREDIEKAARLAGIHEFIAGLPEGYDTELEEGGHLSGGQTQRIGLARALVRDPRIILLDEATAAVDPLVHREIAKSLKEAAAGRTVVIVSHNLFDIQDADIIYVLNNRGELVQQGQHDDLIATPGLYRSMWHHEELGREVEDTQ